MREYGRIVHDMMKCVIAEPDREKRTRMTKGIIDLMSQLNPQLRAIEDYKHKLWDHLHVISDFQLDVDCPYPIPQREELFKKPKPLTYPEYDVRYRNYGRNILAMIEKAKQVTDEEKRMAMTQVIANYMKIVHANWNKEVVSDEMVKADLAMISGGVLQLSENSQLSRTFVQRAPMKNNNNNYRKFNNKNRPGGGGGGNGGGGGGQYGNNNRRKFNPNKHSGGGKPQPGQ